MKKQLMAITLLMALGAPAFAADSGSKSKDIVDNQGRKAKVEVRKNKDGKNEAVVTPEGCADGVSCQQVVLLDNIPVDDFQKIEIAIRKDAEDKRLKAERDAADKKKAEEEAAAKKKEEDKKDDRRKSRRDRSDDKTEREYRTDLREELESAMDSECDISRSSRGSRARYSSDRDIDTLSLTGTRWSGLEIPQSNSKANCAARVLSDFMADHEEELNESVDKEDAKEQLKELKDDIKDLKADLRKAKTEDEKSRIQAKIDAKEKDHDKLKKEIESAQRKLRIANDETARIFKADLIKPMIQDAAANGDAHSSALYRLIQDSPEAFSGVRKAASDAMLGVYKLQAQTQLALRDAANKTKDPALKAQYTQEALDYSRRGMAFNASMMDPRMRLETRENAYKNYLDAYSDNPARPTLEEVREAQSYANSVLKDLYGNYDRGASQITNYLTSVAAGNRPGASTLNLPSILNDSNLAGLNATGTTGTITRGGSARVQVPTAGSTLPVRGARTGPAPRQ